MANTNLAGPESFSTLVFLPQAARRIIEQCLAVALVFVLLGNMGAAQELDSSTLQAEVAAAAREKAGQNANAQQPSPAQSGSAQSARPPSLEQSQAPGGQPGPSAQNQSQTQPSSVQNQPAVQGQLGAMFTIPAGTKLPLGLLRPISVKSSDPVTDVYLQITFPVTVGNQMVIPPGTYIQGVIQRTIPRPRGSAGPGFEMRYANLIFPTGYTVPIAGTLAVMRTSAQALPPGNADGQPVAALSAQGSAAENLPQPALNSMPLNGMPLLALAAFAAVQAVPPSPPPLPPLPKSGFGNTPRNLMIGIGVLSAVAVIAAFAVGHSRRNDLVMETGTPLELVLLAPLQLDPDRVLAAVRQYSTQMATAPPDIVQPPKPPRMCYDPGTPGTPDTVIPGSPGTPATVIPGVNGMPDTVIPGTPATPDTVIAGMPGTPSSTYPCPK
jgi:hypothetical protein